MTMKKILALLCALCLVCACASAFAKTLKPMKSEMSIKDLSDLYFNGELGDYNAKKGTIKVTLYEREPFDQRGDLLPDVRERRGVLRVLGT